MFRRLLLRAPVSPRRFRGRPSRSRGLFAPLCRLSSAPVALATLLFPLGIFLAHGDATASVAVTDCGTLDASGETYILANDVGTGAECFVVTADNITIDGAGFNITGSIGAAGSGASANGHTITLMNTTVSADLNVNGVDADADTGGQGGSAGNVTLTDASIGGTLYANGGNGSTGPQGSAGPDFGEGEGDGGTGGTGGNGGTGGAGGVVTLYSNSTIGTLSNTGGGGGTGGTGGAGGAAGTGGGNPGATGNQGEGGQGGSGGNVYRRSFATIGSATSLGGTGGSGLSGAAPSGEAGVEYVDIPSVTLSAPQSGAVISGTEVTVSATADVYVGPSLEGVSFYIDSTLIGSEDVSSPYSVTLDSTLFSTGAHTIYAAVRNSSNVYATSSGAVTIDDTAPIISSVATSSVGQTTATVTWTTDGPATTKVAYGTASGVYTANTSSGVAATSHSVGLTGLTASTRYYFVAVSSIGVGGITSTSTEYTFATHETWTEQTSSGSRIWSAVASSADGTKLVAGVSGGFLYVSTDSGVTWTAGTGTGSRIWSAVASSADGTKLVAGVRDGSLALFTSTDSGVTWTERTVARAWTRVASSDDGVKLAASESSGGRTYTSTNSGVNWTLRSGSPSGTVAGLASSADGAKLFLARVTGYLYTSTDSGVTWTERTGAGTRTWTGAASSADGTKLAASAENGYIYTSTDSGATWTQQTGSGSRSWSEIASSADGTKLVAGTEYGYIYTSTDSGATWTPKVGAGSRNWTAVASAADGTKLTASAYGGYIYTATQVFPDTTAPTVLAASSTLAAGGYTVGQVVDIDVQFSEAVTSNGNVTVTLETGATDRTCTFSVSGATYGTCDYTVQSGDTSADLTVSSITGTVADAAGNALVVPATPATNLAANEAIAVDTTAPSAPASLDLVSGSDTGSLATDDVTTDTTPDVSMSCEGSAATVYLKEGNSVLDSDTCAAGSVTLSPTVALSSAVHTLIATQADVAGNVSATSTSLAVTVDTAAPTVSLSAPADGASVSGAAVAVSADASDGVAVAGVQFKRSTNTAIGAEDTAAAYGVTWDTTGLADGSQTLIAVARDTAGNYATSSARTVTVDNAAPTVLAASSTLAAGGYTVGQVVDIDVQFSEAVTSTGNVTVTLETGATDRTCTFSVSASTYGTCDYTVQSGDASADLTVSSVTGTVADAAGNALVVPATPATNLAANEAIAVDTTAPSVTLDAPLDGATVSGAAVALGATAADGVSLAGVRFYVDGVAEGAEDASSPFGVTWDTTLVADGDHTLAAAARDAAGNYATSSVSVTVSNAVAPADDEEEEEGERHSSSGRASRQGSLGLSGGVSGSSSSDSGSGAGSSGSSGSGSHSSGGAAPSNAGESGGGSPSGPARFPRDLDVGFSGDDVRALQRFLNARGFPVAASGPGAPGQETDLFGGLTRDALARFQAANGIEPAVGYLGPKTRQLIGSLGGTPGAPEAPAASPALAPAGAPSGRDLEEGSEGDDVRALQNLLVERAAGPAAAALAASGPSGLFGPLTRNALAELQRALGVEPAAGYYGARTRAALGL